MQKKQISQSRDATATKLPEIAPRPMSMTKGNSFKANNEDEVNSAVQPSMLAYQMEMQSPFRLPSDEEVFLFRENERQRRLEGKASSGDQHIWEKKTATNRTQLKHYKNYETIRDDKYTSKTAYNSKDKKIIQEALEIAKERQRNRENGTLKEPVVNLLEQKKEMFLVTMAHGIIQNEIQKLKKTSEDKELALDMSRKMLEQDHENFQKYLENNKAQKVEAEMRAETEIKEKKAREQEIKTLNIRLTSLRTEKTRNEEVVANYKEHKDFLDKLAPKEWNDTKERKRKEKIQECREQWISQQYDKLSQDEENEGKVGRKDRESQKRQNQQNKADLEKAFQKLVDLGEIEEIDEFDDEFEMYFKAPQQLVELFNDLEERNLFLIQTTQDAEQNLEELKNNFLKIKQERETKLKSLSSTKEMLKKNYDSVNQQIKQLQVRGSEKDSKKDYKDLRKQIIDVFELFQNEIILHDHNGKETLEILVAIELHLEKQLKQLRGLPPKQVEAQRLQCEREQKFKQREEHAERLKQEQEERTRKNRDKILQPSKKKLGRQDMFRSAPQEIQEIVKEEEENNEEEEDKKYFME